MTHPATTPPRARKHLMVPGQARGPSATSHSTVMVQRWVLTVLMLSIVLHLAGALALAAYLVDADVPSSRIGLLVIAGVMGALSVAAVLVIHRRNPFSPLLLAGLVPAVVGAYACFGR